MFGRHALQLVPTSVMGSCRVTRVAPLVSTSLTRRAASQVGLVSRAPSRVGLLRRGPSQVPLRHGFRRRFSSPPQEEMEYKGFLGMENMHVVYGIMGANVLVFLGWHASDDVSMMKDHFTLSEENLRAGRFHTLITPVFSHSEVHRLMLSTSSIFLIAGSAVGTLGQARLLGLYLASGLLSSIAGLAIARDSARAQEAPPRTWRFGANGAILGVGGFVANMFPSLPLKAKLLLIPALVAQGAVFSVVGTHSEGDYGHFVGLLAGIALFVGTKRFHPAWRAAVPKYNST